MLAMASNSHNDRLQAKERRNRAPATVNLTGPNMVPPSDDDGLFPVPVRVKRENDDISNRIKGLFHPPASPGVGMSKASVHSKLPSSHDMSQHRNDNTSNRISNIVPQAAQPVERDKSSSKSGRDSKKKSEGSEHKHKHKERDKEKKKKSSRSDERHSKKKSKTTDKSHSPAVKELPIGSGPQPKKIKHRSSSVSSDRSDLSSRSRSSTDKQYTSIKHTTEHLLHNPKTAPSSKSKHSTSGSNTSQLSTSSSHHPNTTSHQTGGSSGSSLSTTHGASNSNKGALNKYSSHTSSTTEPSTNASYADSRNHSSSKVRAKDERPINGLVRPGSKPTNLVIPVSHKVDREDMPVNKILAEMMKPTEKITEIQTPCKVDPVPPYQFLSNDKTIEAPNPETNMSKPLKVKPSQLITTTTTTTKDTNTVKGSSAKPLALKPTKLPNGVVDDLKLSPSVADSDSGSSSSSNSSDSSSSSSSSGSDSDSSNDDEETPKDVPAMLFKMERSPAPAATTECSSDMWDLAKFYEAKPSQPDSSSSKKADGKSSAFKLTSSSTAVLKNNDGVEGKRKRGRPKKEESNKRNLDPDFTPPISGKHLPIVSSPATVTNRQKRLSSSSKSKSDTSKGFAKGRGRPPKKPPAPSAVSTNKDIISSTLSVNRSSGGKNLSLAGESRPNSSTPKPTAAAPIPSSTSSIGDEDVDVDVDVDVVSDKSPVADDSAFLPAKVKAEPVGTVPSAHDRLVAKHEPISPVEPKVEPFTHFNPASISSHISSNGSVRTLLVRIPLKQLQRPPSLNPPGLEPSLEHIPTLPGIKEEKLSPPPPYKRKSTPTNSFLQAMQEAKKRKLPEDELMPLDPHDSSADYVSKDGPRLGTVPSYSGSQLFYTQARELKNRGTNMGSSPNAKPLKHLLAVECVATFMMSGIGKEAEDPKAIQTIKPYYSSTLSYAENTLGDCLSLKESNSTQPQIHKCTQVLCHYVLAHLKHKCYKLLKDQASSCGKHVEEFLHREKNKQSISPHTHAGLPPGNSPAAPSPASITSTSSLTSDSGRGASLPPSTSSVSIPDAVLKDVSEYMKCMNHLSASTDQWKTAHFWRTQSDQKKFFDQLDKDMEYTVDLLTESKPFVHYVHTACLRLKKDLDVATSYSTSYS